MLRSTRRGKSAGAKAQTWDQRLAARSGRAMARTGLRMMPTFPSSPLSFRTAGFPRYGCKAGLSEGAFPRVVPTCRALPVCILPSCPPLPACRTPLCVGARRALRHRHASGQAALPQGPSLRTGFCCPGPSTLMRPHPPHSRAQRDFAARSLYALPSLCVSASATRDWFPAFTAHSFSTCRPLPLRGVRRLYTPSFFAANAGLRLFSTDSALPVIPHTRFPWGAHFGASLQFAYATTCRLVHPPVGSDWIRIPPTRIFTAGLSTVWSPAPSPVIATVATGQFPPAGLAPARMAASIAAH